jgi:large subunit ribosomal protein L2
MLKKLKPTSPGQRHTILLNKKSLSNIKRINKNSKGLINSSGRNNSGKITIKRRGSGNKTIYKKIDFKRTLKNATVVSIEYDSNRTANIAKLYSNGKINYILAPASLQLGDFLNVGEFASFRQVGNCLPLKSIPIGIAIHNIELKLNKGGEIARSAGCFGKILSKSNGLVKILLNSGKEIILSEQLKATIGSVSNEFFKFQVLGKAGRNR